jgi:hypothetical protein
MLDATARLLKDDFESQTDWVRKQVSLQIRSIVILLIFGLVAGICAVGLLAVGLVALYVWAKSQYGFGGAIGLVAVALTAAMLLSVFVLSRSRARSVPLPNLRVTDPSMLKAALSSDARAVANQAFHRAGETPLGAAISAGEQVAQTGEQIADVVAKLKDKPVSTLLLVLGATVVIGALIGRRL